jgi:hypothetical protein
MRKAIATLLEFAVIHGEDNAHLEPYLRRIYSG